MLNKIVLVLAKKEAIRYLSHLELIKALERTLKRSGLPIVYSEGFAPRMKLSLDWPLSVGMTASRVYAQISLSEV